MKLKSVSNFHNYEAAERSSKKEHFIAKRKLYAVNKYVGAFRRLKITVYVSYLILRPVVWNAFATCFIVT